MQSKVKTNADMVIPQINRAQNIFSDTIKYILNSMAIAAADLKRERIPNIFTLRSEYTQGSIFPKQKMQSFGSAFLGGQPTGLGLIPPGKNDWRTMYSQAGTIQPYMLEQEEGYSRNDPMPPTKAARVGRSYTKKIAKKGKLKTLRAQKTLRAKDFDKQDNAKARITAMIETAKAAKEKGSGKGLFFVGKNQYLPSGYWRVKKAGKRKGSGTIELVRLWQSGRRRRKGRKWFSSGRVTFSEASAQSRFNKTLDSGLKFLGRV